jgi:uncharacterized protein
MNGHQTNGNNGRAHAEKLLPEFSAPLVTSLQDGRAAGREDELGAVVGGSLSAGLQVRLDAGIAVEDMIVGNYVTIDAGSQRFFGMITDVELDSTMSKLAQTPPGPADYFLREVYQGTAAFGVLHVSPMLRITGAAGDATPEPVKSVPPHFARVRFAAEQEVEEVFGREDAQHFVVGTPLDMDVKVRLDYERFVERSNGIFGKSGTGKTFLTRMLLLNTMQKSNARRDAKGKTACLVFDMHNEYGWEGTSEGGSGTVPALKQLMPNDVVVYTLDPPSSQRRKSHTDGDLVIGYGQIEPEDMALLRTTINLSENAVDACYALHGRFKKNWLAQARALEPSEQGADDPLLKALSIHPATVTNLRRGIERLLREKEFLSPSASTDMIDNVIGTLLGGKSVVIEFGRYGSNLDAYMLVANVLTRRIHERWRGRMEDAFGSGAAKPVRLMIVIEEAHKFLDPSVAGQTIFGEIAREMRKYNVTLLVIDQRPSAIDPEVMSQFGTRVSCLLDNEKDIDAVLSGVSGKSGLRDVLARLDSKQQTLILGHAVPMPIVVRPETYDADSYARFKAALYGEKPPASKDDVSDLYN